MWSRSAATACPLAAFHSRTTPVPGKVAENPERRERARYGLGMFVVQAHRAGGVVVVAATTQPP
jgi:hypothetical protein